MQIPELSEGARKWLDAFRQWLFANKEGKPLVLPFGQQCDFSQKGGQVFGGSLMIGDTKCRIRIVSENINGTDTLVVRFPHKDLDKIVPEEDTTVVGTVTKAASGAYIFHPIEGAPKDAPRKPD